MSKTRFMRDFISERLTAVAAEIFGVFEQIIFEYEEEIDRQRRVLDFIVEPQLKVQQRADLLQQRDCGERQVLSGQQRSPGLNQDTGPSEVFVTFDESAPEPNRELTPSNNSAETNLPQPACEEDEQVLTDQQLFYQEWNSSLDQGQSDLSPIKEEQEELFPGEVEVEVDTPASPTAAYYDESGRDQSWDGVRKRPRICQICRKSFRCPSELKHHQNIHLGKKPYTCQTCGKSFTYNRSLTVHMRNHADKKPFPCKMCEKSFCRRDNFIIHMRSHTGERPYSCTICNKKYKYRHELTVHMRVHTGERPFFCQICQKGFTQQGNFKTHMKIHLAEKPYSCHICGKGFTQNSSFKKHMHVHTREKPFSCKMCTKNFAFSESLKKHMKVHMCEMQHSCKVCGKRFLTKYKLTAHKKEHKA